MPKKPLSVTLDEDNLLWLRGRAAATKRRSLSEALDAVVTAARTGGMGSTPPTSVVGTVDIAADDPGLEQADAYIADLVDGSLSTPFLARATPGVRQTSASRRPSRRPSGKVARRG